MPHALSLACLYYQWKIVHQRGRKQVGKSIHFSVSSESLCCFLCGCETKEMGNSWSHSQPWDLNQGHLSFFCVTLGLTHKTSGEGCLSQNIWLCFDDAGWSRGRIGKECDSNSCLLCFNGISLRNKKQVWTNSCIFSPPILTFSPLSFSYIYLIFFYFSQLRVSVLNSLNPVHAENKCIGAEAPTGAWVASQGMQLWRKLNLPLPGAISCQ